MSGSEVRLLSVEDAVGVSAAGGKSEVVITSLNGVQIFDLSLTRSTNSWCAARGRNFSSKSIYDVAVGRFCAIMDSTTLVQWTVEDNRIGREDQMVKLISPATALIPTPSQTIILHENGNLSSVNQPDEYFWTYPSDNGKILLKSFTCGEAVHVGFVTEWEGKYQYIHVVVNIAENEGEKPACRLTRYTLKSTQTPIGLNVNDHNGKIDIAIAWSDAVLSYTHLENTINWKFSIKLNDAGFSKPFGLTANKDEILCFYYSDESGLTCLSFNRKFGLEIWNKRFDVSNVTEIDSIKFDNGLIFVAGSAVTLLRRGDQQTLASLFRGKSVSSANQKTTQGEILKWTSQGLKKESVKSIQSSTNIELDIETCCEEGDYEAITKLLRSPDAQSVAESVLVGVLARYLPNDAFEIKSNFIESNETIDSVISIRTDHAFLVEKVSRLSINQVLRLLAYLHSRLKSNLVGNVEVNPEFMIDWIAALIDAHFGQLTTTHDEAVVELYKKVISFVDERCTSAWGEIELIREIALREERLNGRSNRTNSNLRDYDIHVLVF